jgi:alanyl-tRNA synthetase
VQKAEQQVAELRELRHTVEKFKARDLLGEAERFLFAAKNVGGLKVLTAKLPAETDAESLRKVGDFLRDKDENVVALLSAVKEEKITFLAVCGKGAVAKGIKAGDLVRSVSAICGGSGGGKPDSAMGGGKNINQLQSALETAEHFVAEKLGL